MPRRTYRTIYPHSYAVAGNDILLCEKHVSFAMSLMWKYQIATSLQVAAAEKLQTDAHAAEMALGEATEQSRRES